MNLLKKLIFLIFLFSLIAGLLQIKIVRAQTDCRKENDPEHHSLRPYPAEPCDEEVSETALFCGNSLVISDTVSAIQTTPPELDENCTPISDDQYRCTYRRSNTRRIAIDLSGAELPIMGNTELVKNSQQQSEDLDDAEKVNEYVSWYLNGVINRAEYPLLDPTDKEDISKIIDFSGPLRKLLPWDEQARNRIKTIERAVGKDINKDGKIEERDRHNQVFACTFGIPIKIFGIWEVARIIQIPVPCYDKGFLSRFINFYDLRDEKRLSEWGNRLPPLAEDYDNFQDYWVEYKRWRGERCAVAEVPGFIPVVGGKKFIYCFDDPTKPNYWANLFPYIPFSSTEDRVGLVELDSYGIQPVSEDITITNVSIEDWSPAELYFAHMQETSELAEILQKTFVPKEGKMTGGATGVSPGADCDLVNVRTNAGDDLFAGEIGGTLSYDAEFSCIFDRNATESACTKEALVSLSVLTKTPLADDVWSRTVAGPAAIFKRIFPKVGPGGAILGILDIPAATKVNYVGADFAGNPGNQRSGEGAELYFPHIGGISEYFLKGIQTTLRPKGYGEQVLSGAPGTVGGGEINCNESAPDPGPVSGLLSKDALVAEFSGEFPGNNIEKCYNDVVNRAREAGYDPAFAMAIWIEESGASDYEQFPVVYDFGCRGSTPNNDFNAQISCFLNLKNFYLSPIFDSCKSSASGPITMEDFLLIFSEGFRACDSNDSDCYRSYCTNPQFPQRIRDFYSRVSGGRSLPPYP